MVTRPAPKPRKRRKRKPKGMKRGKPLVRADFHWPPLPQLRRRKPMRRGKGPERDTERMAFVRSHLCVVCVQLGRRQRSKSHADHIRSRGAGGQEAGNLWPLCAKHHDERHLRGLRGFEYQYGVDAKTWGAWFEREYVRSCGSLRNT